MRLSEFQVLVAESLINYKQPRKRGRPVSEADDIDTQEATTSAEQPKKKKKTASIVNDSVRLDQIGHFPMHEDRQRCKNGDCVGRSQVVCEKCEVHLCLNNNRNCFKEFHSKK